MTRPHHRWLVAEVRATTAWGRTPWIRNGRAPVKQVRSPIVHLCKSPMKTKEKVRANADSVPSRPRRPLGVSRTTTSVVAPRSVTARTLRQVVVPLKKTSIGGGSEIGARLQPEMAPGISRDPSSDGSVTRSPRRRPRLRANATTCRTVSRTMARRTSSQLLRACGDDAPNGARHTLPKVSASCRSGAPLRAGSSGLGPLCAFEGER